MCVFLILIDISKEKKKKKQEIQCMEFGTYEITLLLLNMKSVCNACMTDLICYLQLLLLNFWK